MLTAAHVVKDAVTIRARFESDLPGEWTAEVEVAFRDAAADVVALRVLDTVDGPTQNSLPSGSCMTTK